MKIAGLLCNDENNFFEILLRMNALIGKFA